MKTTKNKHIGSDFDDFLKEDGTLFDVEAAAMKRVLAFQIEQEMKRQHLTKTCLAKRMGTSRAAVDRILTPDNLSITLQTMGKVAGVLGKKIKISLG